MTQWKREIEEFRFKASTMWSKKRIEKKSLSDIGRKFMLGIMTGEALKGYKSKKSDTEQ